MRRILFLALLFSFSAYSGQAPLEIRAISGNSQQNIPLNSVRFAHFSVTNTTPFSTLLFILSSPAIENIIIDEHSCRNTLDSLQTCILSFKIHPRLFATDTVVGGPVVGINPIPSAISTDEESLTLSTISFWQYQPPTGEQFSLSRSGSDAPVTITSSVPGMALKVSGNTRNITITNNSSEDATGLTYTFSPALPDGTSVTTCDTIAAGGTCNLAITPGTTASGSIDDSTVTMTITSTDGSTNSLDIALNVLDYGSVYQSGYVFSIDDTTSTNESVLGKVVALKNTEPPWPFGIIWAAIYPQPSGGCELNSASDNPYENCTYYGVVGVNEDSTTPCEGKADGACNTGYIIDAVNKQGVPYDEQVNFEQYYAAGQCNTSELGGFNDWYLGAICEMGYYRAAPETPTINSGCGSQDNPYMDNILSNLIENETLAKATNQYHLLFGFFWSSTEFSGSDGTTDNAWDQYYISPQDDAPGAKIQNFQTHDGKEDPSGVRCIRAMTQPTS